MPCEVVPLRVDFSKMAAVAMEMAKMLKKKMKNTKMIIAGYSLGYHGNGCHFEFFSTPSKAATHYGGYSSKVS
jgi:hypothetical protein